MPKQNIYFFSDFHLGRSGLHSSSERQKILLSFFHSIKNKASKIYLVGDIFDYWYEYKNVIPKDFIHFISNIIQLQSEGLEFEFFTGNHDVWMYDFFQSKLGIMVHHDPIEIKLMDQHLFIGHGDGLGPGDYGYKFIKKIFRNRICQWIFSRFHPNFAIGLMKFFSGQSSRMNEHKPAFTNFDEEWLVQYCENHQAKDDIDYYIFGHRHIPINYKLRKGKGNYINLGDSLNHYTYGILNESGFTLQHYYDTGTKIKANH